MKATELIVMAILMFVSSIQAIRTTEYITDSREDEDTEDGLRAPRRLTPEVLAQYAQHRQAAKEDPDAVFGGIETKLLVFVNTKSGDLSGLSNAADREPK